MTERMEIHPYIEDRKNLCIEIRKYDGKTPRREIVISFESIHFIIDRIVKEFV